MSASVVRTAAVHQAQAGLPHHLVVLQHVGTLELLCGVQPHGLGRGHQLGAARQGRNPSTGETIQIAASKKLAFTPAKQVRDAMNPAPAEPAAKGKAKPKKTAA